MLEIKGISKSFGNNEVLRDIDFSIKKGELVALLGENGAGKSTLLKIISGFWEPDTGKVVVDELDVQNNREEFLGKIGYVKEITSLYDEMLTVEFLRFAADVRTLSKNIKDDKIREVVKLLGLEEVLFYRCGVLSKGFKKRLELASVLLGSPEVLLLDEPSEGLDPNQKLVLRKIISQYAKKHVVIISTHTLEDVELLADRVLLLHKGVLEADKPLSEFKKLAKNSLLASFCKMTKD